MTTRNNDAPDTTECWAPGPKRARKSRRRRVAVVYRTADSRPRVPGFVEVNRNLKGEMLGNGLCRLLF